VHDEGRAIRGLDAIKAWKKDAKTKYQYTVEPLDAVQDQATVTLRARLTGKFPGSPMRSRYRFVMVNDKIALWRYCDRTDRAVAASSPGFALTSILHARTRHRPVDSSVPRRGCPSPPQTPHADQDDWSRSG